MSYRCSTLNKSPHLGAGEEGVAEGVHQQRVQALEHGPQILFPHRGFVQHAGNDVACVCHVPAPGARGSVAERGDLVPVWQYQLRKRSCDQSGPHEYTHMDPRKHTHAATRASIMECTTPRYASCHVPSGWPGGGTARRNHWGEVIA